MAIVGAFFFKGNFMEYLARHAYGVKPGVIFLEQDMGGLTQEEVEAIVVAKFSEWQINPVDAFYDPQFDSIIPELWGYELDVPETVDKIMSASREEHVTPVFNPLCPDITMQDYPWLLSNRVTRRKESCFDDQCGLGNGTYSTHVGSLCC